MTTEIEIYCPGKIQNKLQFCARINTFITAVLPHSKAESSIALSYSQEGFFLYNWYFIITGTSCSYR